MIRMIATDVDGTFCNSQSTYNRERFSAQIEKLKELGINFVIASGNQQPAMYRKFAPYSEDMHFVCLNGCTIGKANTILHSSSMDPFNARKTCEVLMRYPDLIAMATCSDHSYILQKYASAIPVLENYFYDIRPCKDLRGIQDDFVHFSLIDPACHIDACYDQLSSLLPENVVPVISGVECIDIMDHTRNKGAGLKELMRMLHIREDECAVFGDQMNDVSMFEAVRYSYAMENAVAPLKEKAHAVCKSNDEEGVLEVIDQIIHAYTTNTEWK
mgnify:CR=1 FL=1